ncbi:DMT family transporter [Rhodanobacter lindaniclasticus]|uniref:EamA family transporter n=1 Tax=Rhodanobacter lindaniclasticus TaxID=75310 RepID=A0A4S3KGB0_9GAMM|nr:DMT family transporter [Rhodanobacter lindaniclasticus]THD07653.1 EamA family transporter [Rhodanobacter lindaniclasticus]
MSLAASAIAAPRRRPWLVFAVTTVALWGVWGALSPLSAEHGFPETLVYCVWALTMIPPALYILWRSGWALEHSPRAIAYGMAIGLLGAGGQMLLFHTLTIGPAYFVFPIISLSPVVTIALSFAFLRERTGWSGALGIVLALVALPMLDLSFGRGISGGLGWFVQSLLIMLAWGVQAYFMRLANHTVRAESIFFYMMLGGLLLAPVALAMTDWSQPINTGIDGPWMTAAIQLLNAIGALTLVYAFRHGKAIVVAPLTNAGAPLVTAALALVFASVVPGPLKMIGLVLALIASLLLVLEPEAPAEAGHDPDVSTPSPEWTPTSCKSSPSSSPATSRDTPVA